MLLTERQTLIFEYIKIWEEKRVYIGRGLGGNETETRTTSVDSRLAHSKKQKTNSTKCIQISVELKEKKTHTTDRIW